MKTMCLFATALTVAIPILCPAQTADQPAAQSNWLLAPPFETTPTPTVAAPARSNQSPTVQTAPTETARSGRRNSESYVEGPVWVITFVRTKPGLSDEYLNSMTGSLKPVYEEEKKHKIILDYKILSGDASSPQDFNVIIMVEYANLGALDGLREKTEPIIDKLIGPADERKDMAAKRLDIREIIATKTMREIWLK
jgi:hypothetical protein